MKVIGIDPSINSTGICIKEPDSTRYEIIVPKVKKIHKGLTTHVYTVDKGDSSPQGKETYKGRRVYEISNIIESIIEREQPDKVVIEAVAFNANGSIDLLAGLNYSIRNICYKRNIEVVIVSPTTLKKESVGSGKASKDIMVSTWWMIEGIDSNIDDLADAYFLAMYAVNIP